MSILIPPAPSQDYPPPRGLAEVIAAYGDVKIRRGPDGWQIVSPPRWESQNCVVVRDFPGLAKPLYVHRLLVVPLRSALTAWQATCPEYTIRTIGAFCPRPKRVAKGSGDVVGWSEGLSVHSVAAAVDINADTNPMRSLMVCDMPDAFRKCFADAGFTWGGTFPTPDPMHFQFGSGI